MNPEPIHLRLIEIKGLFRQYDHRIELRQDEHVTILHGRNGVGKTVSLALVSALLQGGYGRLTRFPFRELRLEFHDHSFIEVRPRAGKGKNLSNKDVRRRRAEDAEKTLLEVRFAEAGGSPRSFVVSNRESQLAQAIARGRPWLVPIDEDRWHDRRTGEQLTLDEFLRRDAREFAIPMSERSDDEQAARALCKRVSAHFIEAQRLFKIVSRGPHYGDAPPVTSAAKDVAAEMAAKIKATDSTYRATSTRLDDSLPARLFGPASKSAPLPEDELRRRTEALEQERQRLRRIGLLGDSRTSFDPNALDPTRQAMFAVYLEDNEAKLRVFNDLADRAEILLKILNHKFEPKRITLDKDEGYRVFSHDQRPLDLERLSSGEQHELVLLHNLLFRVEPGALLLIDEPELSLHVTWQNEFLEDLILIAKKVGFDAVIATHSPYIVGKRRDLMVQLGEPV
jgi:predicted ATPase